MPLPTGYKLTPHFTAGELGADNPEIPTSSLNNLRYTVAPGLERVREILGVPLIDCSGYRTPARNAEVGGSPTSDHVTGLAADFEPKGMTLFAAYRKLSEAADAGKLPAFDQIIYYPADNHIHIGFGPRMRGEVRIKIGEKFPEITNELASKLTGFVAEAGKVATDVARTITDGVKSVAVTLSNETGASPNLVLFLLALFIGFIVWRVTTNG